MPDYYAELQALVRTHEEAERSIYAGFLRGHQMGRYITDEVSYTNIAHMSDVESRHRAMLVAMNGMSETNPEQAADLFVLQQQQLEALDTEHTKDVHMALSRGTAVEYDVECADRIRSADGLRARFLKEVDALQRKHGRVDIADMVQGKLQSQQKSKSR